MADAYWRSPATPVTVPFGGRVIVSMRSHPAARTGVMAALVSLAIAGTVCVASLTYLAGLHHLTGEHDVDAETSELRFIQKHADLCEGPGSTGLQFHHLGIEDRLVGGDAKIIHRQSFAEWSEGGQ